MRASNPKSLAVSAKRAIQFNWRRKWSKRVAPYLGDEMVQLSLDFGMRMLDRKWQRGDAPCDYGALFGNRIVKGKLSWYQPRARCHYIAFFSMAIGVLNYPELDWKFVSGDLHTVPVGYDADGVPRVVMDILLYDRYTAEQSIERARQEGLHKGADWSVVFQFFLDEFVTTLKIIAKKLRHAA